ncbi:MAG: virginiamycin lyase [Solirubrobacteraceae bacterium]|nr:virginiamycin lyase [Solirubrobacteraceae bacterium]
MNFASLPRTLLVALLASATLILPGPAEGAVTLRGATSAHNASTASLALPVPAGTASGDALLAVVDVVQAPAVTAPAGWSLVRADVNASGSRVSQALYLHVATAFEPPTYTWGLAAPHGAAGGMLAYAGVDRSAPVIASSGQTTASSTQITAPSLATPTPGARLVGVFGMAGARAITPPAGEAQAYADVVTDPPGEKVTSLAADETWPSAGATGSRTATANLAGAGTAQLVALNPAAPTGTTGSTPNRAPVIDAVSASNPRPLTDGAETATIAAHDPDGDALTYSYRWQVDGTALAGATSATLDLRPPGHGDKHQTVAVTVVARDARGASASAPAAPVTILDSPPVARVAPLGSGLTTNSRVAASATTSDADGDPVTLTYTWAVNGTTTQSTTRTAQPDGYDLSVVGHGNAGDLVAVRVTPGDGEVAGSPATTSARVTAPPTGTIQEFPLGAGNVPSGMFAGPDGNVWFSVEAGPTAPTSVGRITPVGGVSQFGVPTPGNLGGITAGPDGNMWFTEFNGNKVGRSTMTGGVAEFPVPAGAGLAGITTGSDGNLWLAETGRDAIARMTTGGAITEFRLPSASALPHGPVLGPDGNVWFAEMNAGRIARITPAGVITEFRLPSATARPNVMARGPDGNLWFTEFSGNRIGRITPAGAITEFALPSAGAQPVGIIAGADGNLWFAEQAVNRIGRITTAGAVTEYPVPTAGAKPDKLAAGSDGNVWFTEHGATQIGQLTP